MSTEDTKFQNYGRRLEREKDGVHGTITARQDDRFIIEWDDGSEGFVLAASLHEADAAHCAALAAGKRPAAAAPASSSNLTAAEVIARMQAETKDNVKWLAEQRGGLDPRSPTFGRDVAEAIKSGRVKVSEPKPPAQADRAASIRAHAQQIAGKRKTGGASVAVGHTHTKVGGRGNE